MTGKPDRNRVAARSRKLKAMRKAGAQVKVTPKPKLKPNSRKAAARPQEAKRIVSKSKPLPAKLRLATTKAEGKPAKAKAISATTKTKLRNKGPEGRAVPVLSVFPSAPAPAAPSVTAGAAPIDLSEELHSFANDDPLATTGPFAEQPLRDTDAFKAKFGERLAHLPQALIPLSHTVRAELWALDLTDASGALAQTGPAPAPAGETQITALTEGGREHELATYKARSGLTAVRTIRVSERTAGGQPFVRLVPVRAKDGEPVRETISGLRITNKRYDTRTFTKEALQGPVVLDGSMVRAISKPDGEIVQLIGRAPIRHRQFEPEPGAQVRITAPNLDEARRSTRLNGNRCFVFASKTDALFPAGAPDAELRLEIDERPKRKENDKVRKIELTYRITRNDDLKDTGAKAGANNTTRTKLIQLAPSGEPIPPLEAKDIPPIHLLLLPEPA